MLVKEIMVLAAELCGRRDLADFLAGRTGADAGAMQREEETLLRCFNLTENEIALDYLPIRRRESFVSDGGVPYAAFSCPPAEIFAVRGPSGEKLAYTALGEGLRVRAGAVEVEYSCRPSVKAAADAPEAGCRDGGRLLALGTACEFALMSGDMETAALLDKRYRDALACACRERGGRFRLRSWV